jgi:gamma-glutamylcyclotransferase (GGCT)/AIG2-like uncharacterized protein YtfP
MHYFAYGSNMNYEHMRRLCGRHFTILGVATLENFQLGLDLRGYVNIKAKENSKVFGVLYELDQSALDILDEFEGYPYVFDRKSVEVKSEDGQNVNSWVYLENADQFGGDFVKAEHLKRVVSGAMENHLPEEWIKFLLSFQ